MQFCEQSTTDDPRPLREFNDALPRDLETIVLKALSKEPDRRYATAGQVADDLRSFLQDRPIQARRPSLADRAAKWVRRHKPHVAAFSIVAVATLGAIAGWLNMVDRQNSNTAKALVTRLMDAEASSIPNVIQEMENFRKWVNPALEQIHLASHGSSQSVVAGFW